MNDCPRQNPAYRPTPFLIRAPRWFPLGVVSVVGTVVGRMGPADRRNSSNIERDTTGNLPYLKWIRVFVGNRIIVISLMAL